MKVIIVLFILLFPSLVSGEEMDSGIFLYRPVNSWVGEKFIFHQKPEKLQKFRYDKIFFKDYADKNNIEAHPLYEDYGGHIVTVTEVDLRDEENFTVNFKDDINGTLFEASTTTGYIEGIIPLTDVENAKKNFTGRSLWYLKNNILSYDSREDRYIPVYAERFEPVKIIDVRPGWNNKTPVRLIVETPHAETGFIDINLSGTNVSKNIREKDRLWDILSLKNPKHWPVTIKELVAKRMVAPGMTYSQVRMSWGEPLNRVKISDREEKWIYPYGDTLYFYNGKMEKKRKQ